MKDRQTERASNPLFGNQVVYKERHIAKSVPYTIDDIISVRRKIERNIDQ